MAVLTAKTRKQIPAKDFALSGGRYPIHDEAHARDALSRVSANGTPAEKAAVRAKVRKKYPNMKINGQSAHQALSDK
jgi:cystathionine beta-lyase family protein involved in aluminum resistance